MYFIRTYESPYEADVEMGFNLAAYQNLSSKVTTPVWQTIFLDANTSERWTKDKIDPSSVVLEKWWKQPSARVQHFLKVVPWLRMIQGENTLFAGSWTLI